MTRASGSLIRQSRFQNTSLAAKDACPDPWDAWTCVNSVRVPLHPWALREGARSLPRGSGGRLRWVFRVSRGLGRWRRETGGEGDRRLEQRGGPPEGSEHWERGDGQLRPGGSRRPPAGWTGGNGGGDRGCCPHGGACRSFSPQQQKAIRGASLVTQWIRVHLPTQETQVLFPVSEDPTCWGATKLMGHNY